MASWVLKAIAQRVIGALPYRELWNEFFQEWVSHSLRLDEQVFEEHLRKDAQHLDYLRKHTREASLTAFTVFELGTGWHPILPIALFLCGAERVWTLDLVPQLRLKRLADAARQFVAADDRGGLRALLPRLLPDRVAEFRRIAGSHWPSPQRWLEAMNIFPLYGDRGYTQVPSGSVDLVVSNAVLEYVAPGPMRVMLAEFKRMLSPHGVMSHDIDLRDQFSFLDPSITPFHFLKWSDRAWRIINNPLIPMNRLRYSDYRKALVWAGFEIVEEHVRRGSLDQLRRVPLAKRFRTYAPDDLRVVKAWFVARSVGSGRADPSSTFSRCPTG